MNYALITGASSGIGFEISKEFARNGYNLFLISKNENKLVKAKERLKQEHNIDILTLAIDLSEPDSVKHIFETINKLSISCNYLINNAGFYIKGPFNKTLWDEELKLIHLQCLTYTHLTKLFIQNFQKDKKGGILNVGSTGSFVPGPYNAVYCACKSFVLSFTEALAEELSNTNITITALCPGGTYTDFQDFNTSRNTILFPIMSPSKVAQVGFKDLMKGKRISIPGFMNKFQVTISRLIPRKLAVKIAANAVKQ